MEIKKQLLNYNNGNKTLLATTCIKPLTVIKENPVVKQEVISTGTTSLEITTQNNQDLILTNKYLVAETIELKRQNEELKRLASFSEVKEKEVLRLYHLNGMGKSKLTPNTLAKLD